MLNHENTNWRIFRIVPGLGRLGVTPGSASAGLAWFREVKTYLKQSMSLRGGEAA